jgi:hypothetical protein
LWVVRVPFADDNPVDKCRTVGLPDDGYVVFDH